MADLNVIYRIAADISGLKSGVDRAAASTEKLESMAATVGKALTAAFTIGAIVKLGKDIVDFAGNLADLSAQTGISTTGLQKFDLAFSQAGVTMDTVAAASAKLAKSLIEGDKSTVSALQKLGLSVAELKRMAPEDQFIKVADAIGQIENPTERAYAAMQIFGKGGVELLKGLDGQLAETIAKFEEMGLIVDEETIQQIDDFGDQIGVLGKQFIALGAEAIGPLMPMLGKFMEALINIAHVIGQTLSVAFKIFMTAALGLGTTIELLLADLLSVVAKIPGASKVFGDLSGTIAALRADAQEGRTAIVEMWTATDQAGESAKKATPALIGLGHATDDAAKAAKKAAEAQRDFHNWIVMREFEDAAEEARRLAEATAEAARQQDLFNRMLFYGGSQLETMTDLMRLQEKALLTPVGTGWLTQLPNLLEQGVKSAVALKANLASILSGQNIGDVIVQGLTGGGGFGGAIKGIASQLGGTLTQSLGGVLSKSIGGTLGKTIGGIVGPLGSLLGPLLDKVGGFFKNLFGGREKETNRIREEFVQLNGGLGELNEKAARAGVTLTRMLNAKTPEAYKKAIDDLNKALKFQDQAMETLDATVKKYGLTIQELGPAFAKQELHKKAQELYQDFKVLAAAGVPIDTIIKKMGASLNEFVRDAIKTGTEVPKAMKPLLQQMIDHGELLDENGHAYESLEDTGLSFSETMTEGFNRLIDEVKRLTDAIARGLGVALDNLPENVDININTHYNSDGVAPPIPGSPMPGPIPPDVTPPPDVQVPTESLSTNAMMRQVAAGAMLQPSPAGVSPFVDVGRVNVDLTMNIDGVFSDGDLVSTIQRRVVPIIHETWNANVAGTRTQARDVLGVA